MPAFKAEAGEAAAQTWTEASLRELKESSHMTAVQWWEAPASAGESFL